MAGCKRERYAPTAPKPLPHVDYCPYQHARFSRPNGPDFRVDSGALPRTLVSAATPRAPSAPIVACTTIDSGDAVTYDFEMPGLAQAVARTPVEPKHAALLDAVRSHRCLNNAKVGAWRNGSWLSRRKVVTAAGDLVDDDHEAWLEQQCALDGGNLSRTVRRLRALDHRLTECEITTLYLIHDRGGRQQDFAQLTVHQEDEFIERRLFSVHDTSWRRSPKDVSDVVGEAEDGELFSGETKVRFRPPAYRLACAVDFAAFLQEAVAVEGARRLMQRQRVVMVAEVFPGEATSVARPMTVGELDPEGGRFAWAGQRLFDDWSFSSAGRSGARLCDHWVFQTADYTSRARGNSPSERSMSFVPVWTFRARLAEVARRPASVHALYGKLETIDRRTGVPFGWYFWMLHGNRVHDAAGRAILEAAEAGKIVLPEHDYMTLKSWYERPYGF